MNTARRGAWLWLLAGLVVLGSGCSNEDSDRLARVAALAARKAEGATTGANSKVAASWQVIRANLDEVAVDARVAARLKWDKVLQDASIEVRSAGAGEVELKGTVRELAHRRRAVEVAESTIGVEKVTDGLEVAAP
jgi:osmotically-inducible protein OsmY